MVNDEELGEMPDGERYEQLVDLGRIDELLREVTEEQIAEAWARYENKHVGTNDTPDAADWWAVHLWYGDEWYEDERRVRDGILRLVDLAANDAVLQYIGVSIMEGDFFTAVPSRLEWVEVQARESARFRRVLGNLQLWNQGDGVAERVERAAGTSLP